MICDPLVLMWIPSFYCLDLNPTRRTSALKVNAEFEREYYYSLSHQYIFVLEKQGGTELLVTTAEFFRIS